ncbi:MAG: GNAT family N-acetyltransferase [Nakamurella sp.]
MSTPDATDLPAELADAGLTGRPLQVSDAEQIAQIQREMELREPADLHESVEEIIEELTSPMVDLPAASLGLFDGEQLIGYTGVSAMHDDTVFKAYLVGGVRTAWTRRGIGTQLVRIAQQQAVAWRDRVAPGLPGEFALWAESQRSSLLALGESLGFETWRYFFRMQRDLEQEVVLESAAADFDLRPYRAEDSEPVRAARNNSFADHWGSLHSSQERWTAHMTGAESFRPELSFVATFTEMSAPDDGQPGDGAEPGDIAAFVMSEEFAGETAGRGFRTAYVALVGTVRAARGRGLASVLLGRQLQAAREAGFRYAELSVDSDSPTGAGRIYEQAGFVELDRNRALGLRFI